MPTKLSGLRIRAFRSDDTNACEALLAGLGDWFAIEASNREYIDSLPSRPAVVADADGRTIGFLSMERHNARSAEIHVLAVDRSLHRRGVGAALVGWAERWCMQEGVVWLHVKTRGPSTPDPGYERTRAFYLALGFEALFETLDLWGPQDAALVLVKHLAAPWSPSAGPFAER